MKRSFVGLALVLGFVFLTASAFANPAMMKKHPGYPDETGKATTDTGASALTNSAEDAPKTLKEQLKAEDTDRAGNVFSDDPRVRKHPGYPDRGVTENMIKDASKVNAKPK